MMTCQPLVLRIASTSVTGAGTWLEGGGLTRALSGGDPLARLSARLSAAWVLMGVTQPERDRLRLVPQPIRSIEALKMRTNCWVGNSK